MTIRLREPPIVEVICGFFFSPLQGIDPILVGKLWAQRAADYPGRELHPAIVDHNIFTTGVGPLRTWLVSDSGEYLVQIQQDRLYFNWRKRGEQYPHFSGESGVQTRGLKEFASFSSFCEAELGLRPEPKRVELAKVDLMVQPKHWNGTAADLGTMLPALRPLLSLTSSESWTVSAIVNEQRGAYEVRTEFSPALDVATGQDGFRVQTRSWLAMSERPLAELFTELNGVVNSVFFDLVPATEYHRFGGVAP